MEALLKSSDANTKNIVYKRYLKWLYKEKNYAACVHHASNMTTSHPNDVYGFEWICKTYCENYDQANSDDWRQELKHPIDLYAEQLLELNPNSNLALLIKALHQYASGQFIPARQLALQAQSSHQTYKVTLVLLARIHMELGAFRLALKLWLQLGLEDAAVAECLSYEKDEGQLKEAIRVLKTLDKSPRNLKTLAR